MMRECSGGGAGGGEGVLGGSEGKKKKGFLMHWTQVRCLEQCE